MRLFKPFLLVLFLHLPAVCRGQEIPFTLIGKTSAVTVVEVLPLSIVIQPDIGFYRWTYPVTTKANDRGNVLEITDSPRGDLTVQLKLESAVYDDASKRVKYITKFQEFKFYVGGVAPNPPTPPTPTPDPPVPPKPPTPQPVTSFRVIFVYESAKTLPQGQIVVMEAKVVRDYLTVNCTPEGGWAGWRKYDKDQDSSKDQPGMNAVWQATKPALTTVPCVAIEVNGHVDIVPLAATPTAMVDVFKKYKSGGGG